MKTVIYVLSWIYFITFILISINNVDKKNIENRKEGFAEKRTESIAASNFLNIKSDGKIVGI